MLYAFAPADTGHWPQRVQPWKVSSQTAGSPSS